MMSRKDNVTPLCFYVDPTGLAPDPEPQDLDFPNLEHIIPERLQTFKKKKKAQSSVLLLKLPKDQQPYHLPQSKSQYLNSRALLKTV